MNRTCFPFLLAALMAPILWTGCSENGLPYEDPSSPSGDADELVEIRLRPVASSLETATRAPFVGAIGSENSLVAKVLLTAEEGKYLEGIAKGYYNGTMTFAGVTATGFTGTSQYYPTDGSNIWLCGLYPNDDRWTNYADDATKVDFAFDGKTDLMAAAQVQTNKAEAKEGTYKELKFHHLLTNLIVLAQVETEAGVTAKNIQDAWGRITGIELTKALTEAPKDKATVSLAGTTSPVPATYSVASTGTYAAKFYNASGTNYPVTSASDPFAFRDTPLTASEGSATVIPESVKAVAYSLVAPVEATGTNDFELLVKTEKNPSGVAVNVSLGKEGSTQGQYCLVTLKFKSTSILATASVEDWKAGATADSTIQ